MKKLLKFDKDKMQSYIDDKLIQTTRHPSLPLTIYNYTKLCQYSRMWDSYTIAARGLVLDDDFNVVARGYDKFFNYGEVLDHDFGQYQHYTVTEKLDGQYIAVFHYKGEWIIMSKGSFTSTFAEKAKEILDSKNVNLEYWSQRFTYVFELIWSKERIVIDYGGVDKLVMTGMVIAKNDTHLDIQLSKRTTGWGNVIPMDIARSFGELATESVSFEDLLELDSHGEEGFVINFFKNSNAIEYKMKIKFADYVRLHSIMTGLSARNIWEDMLGNGGKLSESLLATIPDEMYDWVHEISKELREKSKEIYFEVVEYYNAIAKTFPDDENYDREFAIMNEMNTPENLRGVVYHMKKVDLTYDDIALVILKQLRPGPNIMFGDKLIGLTS